MISPMLQKALKTASSSRQSPFWTMITQRSVLSQAQRTNGSYKAGEVISVVISFNVPVTVTGNPQLLLETGVTDRAAEYASGSGTAELVFDYTVQAGDISSDLDYKGTGSLILNGGTIRNSGLDASLSLPVPGAANSISANKAIVIDTTAPAAPSTPDLAASSDTGTSNTDNITNGHHPHVHRDCGGKQHGKHKILP